MIKKIKLSQITTKTENYRTSKENDVSQLMASIKKVGLLNPLSVKKTKDGYRLVAGFRRYNALKKLKHNEVEVKIVSSSNSDISINLIENMQRENTSSFEVGRGIYNIMQKDKITKSECAVLLGINSKTLNNYLELYESLPVQFRDKVFSVKRGSTRTLGKGMISNSVALAVINAKKSGFINGSQATSILKEAMNNKSIKSTNITAIAKSMNKNKTAKESASKTKSMTLKINISEYHYKKLGKNPHKKIKDVIQSNLKIKFL